MNLYQLTGNGYTNLLRKERMCLHVTHYSENNELDESEHE